MRFADGMEEAMAMGESFGSTAEAAAYWAEGAADVPVEDVTYPGAAGQDQAARIYRAGPDARVLLYIHGGGWAEGSIALNEWVTRSLCAQAGWTVVSISYRLSPAHPFPAGLQDCGAALDWLGGPVVVGGASAGSNLAMATALARGGADVAGLLLFYGVFGHDTDTASYSTYENGPGLTRQRMRDLFDMYDPEGQRVTEPLIAPLLSPDLGALPPTCLIAAEHDVLLDDSRQMAAALKAAGVPHALHIEPGVTHGFINRGRLVPAANAAIARGTDFLKHLHDTGQTHEN